MDLSVRYRDKVNVYDRNTCSCVLHTVDVDDSIKTVKLDDRNVDRNIILIDYKVIGSVKLRNMDNEVNGMPKDARFMPKY